MHHEAKETASLCSVDWLDVMAADLPESVMQELMSTGTPAGWTCAGFACLPEDVEQLRDGWRKYQEGALQTEVHAKRYDEAAAIQTLLSTIDGFDFLSLLAELNKLPAEVSTRIAKAAVAQRRPPSEQATAGAFDETLLRRELSILWSAIMNEAADCCGSMTHSHVR